MLVREVVETTLTREYWVEAELAEARESRGHLYMELVEKDERSNTPIARASAKCWHSQWMLIQPHFERVTGQRLQAGMKVRLKVYAQFHEVFGFSWIVSDIDPNFTLGDLARRRQEIIRQLKEEGIFDLQKSLELPLFCQHIAVISSKTAAGFGDFCRQIEESPFDFHIQLFPAIMQGEGVEQSIIAALNEIYGHSEEFDCVVIIRGGGATADMSGFDTLALAENVAQFPLPIITGIGHDRDECVLDMVSFLRVKTPTAAAAFLTDHLQLVADRIEEAENRIAYYASNSIARLKMQLNSIATRIPTLFSLVRTRQEARLDHLQQSLVASMRRRTEREQERLINCNFQLTTYSNQLLTQSRHRLELLAQRCAALDRQQLLKRGYSITLFQGKAIRNADMLAAGDEIETRLDKGTIKSIVK